MREVDILLSSCAWALRSTVSAVTGKSPGQLAFKTDMIMQAAIEVNWTKIMQSKNKMIEKNSKFENAKRINHTYQVGDFIKIMHEKNSRMRPTKLSAPSEGPYKVLHIYDNSTVKIQRGGYREIISMTRIAPFFKKEADAVAIGAET